MEIASQKEAQSWYSVITDFPNYLNNLQRNLQGLAAQSNYLSSKHPELIPSYKAMMTEGTGLNNKMLDINKTITGIKNSWSAFTGWLSNAVGMSGLGILPIIPVAIGAAAAGSTLYLVGQWLSKAAEMAARIDMYKSEEAKGSSPDQAALRVNQVLGEPSGGKLFGLPIKWLVIGGIAIFILPVVLPLFKRK